MKAVQVLQELRFGARALLAQPAFSALVVLVLAAGLACVLFMLTLINGLLIRPLPFAGADNLFFAGWSVPEQNNEYAALRAPEFLQLRDRLPAGARAVGYYAATVNLGGGERPERYDGAVVSGDLFGLLGVAPALGRGFSDADRVVGAPLTVVLSDAIWRTRYHADPSILGKPVRANGRDATVIGVMPAEFSFPTHEVVWLPAQHDMATAEIEDRDGFFYEALVSVSRGDAPAIGARLDSIRLERAKSNPERYKPLRPVVKPAAERFVSRNDRSLLTIMLCAVVLVFIIACANAANLLLTRTLAKRQELAVRAALGAGRSRLVAHVLAQTLVLAVVAAAIGLIAAQLGSERLIEAMWSDDEGPPHWMRFGIDATIASATIALALFGALLSGLLPALRASRAELGTTLRDGGRGTGSGGFARVSRYLVMGEVALSCVLLISAGVMISAIVGLERADIGIHDTDNLLTARIALFPQQYPNEADRVRLFDRVTERVRAEPGVEDATIANVLPGNIGSGESIAPEGFVVGDAGFPWAEVGSVDDRFVGLYKVKLLEGRALDAHDTADSQRVALVDTDYVKRFVPEGSAIGKRVRIDPDDPKAPFTTIVGVIEALQLDDIDDPRRPTLLVPLRQVPQRYVSLAVRMHADPLAFAPRLNEIMGEIDPDTPLYWVRDYDAVARAAISGELLLSKMFAVFGAIALLLASAGLYGLIAFNVGARTREIGLRRALGAANGPLLASIVGQSGRQVAIGLAIGLALGVPFASLLVKALPGVSIDAASIAGVVVVLALTSVLAAALPAARALRVDPMQALRYE